MYIKANKYITKYFIYSVCMCVRAYIYICICMHTHMHVPLCAGRSKGKAGIHLKYNPEKRDTFEMYLGKVMHMIGG